MTEIDFSFAWEGASAETGAWRHLNVAEIRGTEAISSLYHYEITALVRDGAPEIDPDDLIQARATLRISPHRDTAPAGRAEDAAAVAQFAGSEGEAPAGHRVVHGIITEAEEIGSAHGGTLYRLVLSPPLARAMHRTRCRIFLAKTTRQIIEAVLTGDPALQRSQAARVEPDDGASPFFEAAKELFTWRVADTSRIDDVATRAYCVQYNESDFAFVSRLLEEEGIGYHFENGDRTCLLVLADTDVGRARLEPFVPLGQRSRGRVVTSMKLGARLRPRKVTLLDYNWKKPALSMAVEKADGAAGDLVDHEYPGRYPDAPNQGQPLAKAKLDRLEVEASYAVGEGNCRALSAGTIFALDYPSARHSGEYLITRLEVRGHQHGVMTWAQRDGGGTLPYSCTFECARRGKGTAVAESRFRPARSTPKPRILGAQTAFVTAEPSASGAEINVGGPPGGEIGCVRVRFHWDTDAARAGESSSCWVRVSQVFAGAGQGAVWHPRVGAEVIVEHEDGDPDRPIIVGRVYNGQNLPPTVVPTVSTMKSMTSPGGGTYNELTFDDTAGSQQIKLHTPKDWNSEVGNDRTETVAVDSTSGVGANRSESTGADRSTMVGANNTELVAANETITVGANQAMVVGEDQSVSVGANQTISVGGNQEVAITGNQTVAVTGNQDMAITGNQGVAITGNQGLSVTGSSGEEITGDRGIAIKGNDSLAVEKQQGITVTGDQVTDLKANHYLIVALDHGVDIKGKQTTEVVGIQQMSSKDSQRFFAPNQMLNAENAQMLISKNFGVNASEKAKITCVTLDLSGKTVSIVSSGDLVLQGKNVKITGETVAIEGGAKVEVHAALIKLN